MDHSSSKPLSFSSPLVIIGISLFAIGLIVGGIVGVVYQGGVEEIRTSLASVRGEVLRMRSDSDGLRKKLNGVQVSVETGAEAFTEKLSAESDRIGQLTSKVDGLESGQAALKSEDATLAGKLAEESQRIGKLDGAVKAIGGAQTALKAENTKFAGQLAAEIRRITALDAKVQGVEKAAASGAAETKRLAAEGTAIRSELKSLQSEFGNTDASFDKLVGALSGLGAAN